MALRVYLYLMSPYAEVTETPSVLTEKEMQERELLTQLSQRAVRWFRQNPGENPYAVLFAVLNEFWERRENL